jgi:hypothetical protein
VAKRNFLKRHGHSLISNTEDLRRIDRSAGRGYSFLPSIVDPTEYSSHDKPLSLSDNDMNTVTNKSTEAWQAFKNSNNQILPNMKLIQSIPPAVESSGKCKSILFDPENIEEKESNTDAWLNFLNQRHCATIQYDDSHLVNWVCQVLDTPNDASPVSRKVLLGQGIQQNLYQSPYREHHPNEQFQAQKNNQQNWVSDTHFTSKLDVESIFVSRCDSSLSFSEDKHY